MKVFMKTGIRSAKRMKTAALLAGACTALVTGSVAAGIDALDALDALDASLKGAGAPAGGLESATDNATVNLLRLLVKRGVVSHEDAVDLIRQAEYEAAFVKSQSQAVQNAAKQIEAATQSEIEYNESDIRITYIPDTVKAEIAEDVSHNVMDRARRENWVSAPPAQDWLSRLSLFADFRLRYEIIQFPSGNEENATGLFDFNAVNTGKPWNYMADPFVHFPAYNKTENRQRARIRARFGFEAQMEEGFSLGARIATGSGSSPVSTNQTIGSPGGFSRYSIWLDRAYLRWDHSMDVGYGQNLDVTVSAGRFANPFFSSEILWDNDINFDGIALNLKHRVSDELLTFLTLGAFPVYNTSLNFFSGQTSTDTSKFKSEDRWLFAVQGGIEQAITKDIDLKLAVGYYHFENVAGRLSSPFTPLVESDAGDTDGLRPTFAQKGNTYIPLRHIVVDPSDPSTADNQWQYFGLATPFSVLSVTSKVDFNHFEPFQISLFAEYINNLALNANSMLEKDLFNNVGGHDPVTGRPTSFNGGSTAWIVGVSAGDVVLDKRWDWRVGVDYRYVESDSFIDGFVDSDFGLGGTNLKGFSIGGKLALSRGVDIGLRWMSASEVSGVRFRSDIFQIDLSAEF